MNEKTALERLNAMSWSSRILSEEEFAQALELAKEATEENVSKRKAFQDAKRAFQTEMVKGRYSTRSSEYKYVETRISGPVARNYASDVQSAQDRLKREQVEKERQEAQKAQANEWKRQQLAKMIEDANQYGVDVSAHFGDEKSLKGAINAAKEVEYERLLAEAPYYVLASFYGHSLRGDWSEGRRSFGCYDLRTLTIPDEDAEHPKERELALELREDAQAWEGDDGRYFRSTYQALDAIMNAEDAALVAKLDQLRIDLYYS